MPIKVRVILTLYKKTEDAINKDLSRKIGQSYAGWLSTIINDYYAKGNSSNFVVDRTGDPFTAGDKCKEVEYEEPNPRAQKSAVDIEIEELVNKFSAPKKPANNDVLPPDGYDEDGSPFWYDPEFNK
jgi:hypothetical protein